MRRFVCIAFALPVMIAATTVDAQQQQPRNAKNQMSEEAIAARRECFAEAKIRAPGQAEANSNLATLRENAYKDCAHRKGVRP